MPYLFLFDFNHDINFFLRLILKNLSNEIPSHNLILQNQSKISDINTGSTKSGGIFQEVGVGMHLHS